MSTPDRLRIAVFIDFDNIEIGVKNTLGAAFDAGLVLEALKERGEVVSKMAYSDWQRAGGYSRALTQHAIRMVQRNLTPGGDKNGADINLALDALEMAFTHPHINAFVIVGGDSDFISLVEKLKQYDKKVFVVGGQQFTSVIMQRNCHEFIAYENLIGGGRRQSGSRNTKVERTDLSQVIPLVKRAMKVLLERDVDPQLGLLKSTLVQLDSTFSERSYGAGTFRDFAQKLEKAGVLQVYQAKGSWLVAAIEGTSMVEVSAEGDTPAPGEQSAAESAAPRQRGGSGGRSPRESRAPRESGESRESQQQDQSVQVQPQIGEPDVPVQMLGGAAQGVSEMHRIISGTEVRKWPLYLRTVKQILRSQTPPFDERAYGFASLVDLLRASHREGAFRVERDRQGVMRVFQSGSGGLSQPSGEAAPQSDASPTDAPVGVHDDAPPVETVEPTTPVEAVQAATPTKLAKAAKKARAPRKPRVTQAKASSEGSAKATAKASDPGQPTEDAPKPKKRPAKKVDQRPAKTVSKDPKP
ncbi:MAG: NYN domain-containing protein [Acidobacteria bacterium]|nr:NYN domain-containing protein [Acidobacteriota bacterium]